MLRNLIKGVRKRRILNGSETDLEKDMLKGFQQQTRETEKEIDSFHPFSFFPEWMIVIKNEKLS